MNDLPSLRGMLKEIVDQMDTMACSLKTEDEKQIYKLVRNIVGFLGTAVIALVEKDRK